MTPKLENLTTAEKVRKVDPNGTLVEATQRIGTIALPHLDHIVKAAMEAQLRHAPAEIMLRPYESVEMQTLTTDFYRDMLLHIDGEAWRGHCRKLIEDTRYGELPVCVQLLSLSAAMDKIRDLVLTAAADAQENTALLDALRHLALLGAETICSIHTQAMAQKDAEQREQQRAAFAHILTDQIDGTTQLGLRLRDQARETSSATRGMLDKASEVAAAAEQSAIAMREAAHTSSGLIRAIDDARSEVDDAADVAALASQQAGDAVEMSATLSDHAKSIESILGLIRDIAGQTNLLALNATIEAARAGDAGRGFAVVAQEVKSLANQTARATDDIAQKIAAIQNATRLSVETNERIRATVQDVHSMGVRIRSAMDAQSQTVTMITAAVDETALAADSMSSNISAIRQDTEIVASEIDALEQGFNDVQIRLDRLRSDSEGAVQQNLPIRARAGGYGSRH